MGLVGCYSKGISEKEKITRPIQLEIVTHLPTTYGHCRRCEVIFDQAGIDRNFYQKEASEYPSDLKEGFLKLSEWMRELTRLYKHRLLIKLVDVQSLVGFYKSLRHRIRRYPAFIIEGKEVYTGWDKNRLEILLDKHLKASLSQNTRGRG